METTTTKPAPARVWLVFVDHSVLGVWESRSKALRAVKLRRADSLLEVSYRVEEYALVRGAK